MITEVDDQHGSVGTTPDTVEHHKHHDQQSNDKRDRDAIPASPRKNICGIAKFANDNAYHHRNEDQGRHESVGHLKTKEYA